MDFCLMGLCFLQFSVGSWENAARITQTAPCLLQFHGKPNLIVPILLTELVVRPQVQNFDCKIIFLLVLRGGKPRSEDHSCNEGLAW